MTRPHFKLIISTAITFWSLGIMAISEKELTDSDYLYQMTHNEQSVNDKVENTKIFTSIKNAGIPNQYLPESNGAFPLTSYLVPESELVIINTTQSTLASELIPKPSEQKVRFFVHPLSKDVFSPFLKSYPMEHDFLATPLSSIRSLYVWNSKKIPSPTNFMNLKVSLDAMIGGSHRLLSRSQIERASAVSLALHQVDKKSLASQGIHFIDEPYSVYLKKYPYGYTFREIPKLRRGAQLIPMFSLYARAGKDRSLLQEMMDADPRDPREFVKDTILSPLIHHMFELAFTEGLIGEPHEQNVLVEIKDHQLTGHFYYRDLAGFQFNPKLRSLAGKNLNFIPKTFDLKNLKFERAQLIENLKSYLVQSNFFALKAATSSSLITQQWLEKTSLSLATEELEARSGFRATSWSAIEQKIRHLKKPVSQCSILFKDKL